MPLLFDAQNQKPEMGIPWGEGEMEIPQPVGAWLLNDGGAQAWDSSGNRNHGTLTNMDPATDWVWTPYGSGLDFDATDDCVSLGTGFAITGNFSVEAIFMLSSIAADRSILSKFGAGAYSWILFFDLLSSRSGAANVLSFAVGSGGSGVNASAETAANGVAANVWYHAIGVHWDGVGQKVYINGVDVTAYDGPLPTTSAIGASTVDTRIGYRADLVSPMSGQCAFAAIYGVALTSRQVGARCAYPFAPWRPSQQWWYAAAGGAGNEYIHAQTGVMIVSGTQAVQAEYLAAQAGALVLTGTQVAQAAMVAAQVGAIVLTGEQATQAAMIVAQAGSLVVAGGQSVQADYIGAQVGELILTGEQLTQALYVMSQIGVLQLTGDQLVTLDAIMSQVGTLIITATQSIVVPGVGAGGWLAQVLSSGYYR